MSNLTINATLVSITEFNRVNTHIPSHPIERFVCVTMQAGEDANLYVTMTRVDTRFAMDIQGLMPGDTFVVGCKFKEIRNDSEYGHRIQVTNCVLGGFKVTEKQAMANSAREAKKAARLAALGL